MIPTASADLVLSPDLLEGARAVEYLGKDGLLIVDEDYQISLSILLDRGIDSPIITKEMLQKELKEKLGSRVVMAPLKEMSFKKFQKPVYASAMILGIAYQAGKLPFEESDLKDAFLSAVPKQEFKSNWEAFHLGREWYLDQDKPKNLVVEDQTHLWERSVGMVAYPWQSKDKFINLMKSFTSIMSQKFPEIPLDHLRHYIHDLIVFDQGAQLNEFLELAQTLKKKYFGEELSIALRVLAKTFWIKDEVFVSHLMVSPLKTQKDQEKYKTIGSSFKVVHINRPSFVLFGKKIEFDFSPRHWMLLIMRHL
ncbi:MAG: hypothetical protein EBX37_19035, partial [Alphaproteobacteria bacterium]|nr:hypothetical protein [Alphaproteobacteria bacterium]